MLFDTRDAIDAPPGPGGEHARARHGRAARDLSSLDIPELEPVPHDHVLTKTFYLLQRLPRPLRQRPALGRGAAGGDEDEGQPSGARRRRRLARS